MALQAGNGQRRVCEQGQFGTTRQSHFFFIYYFISSNVDAKVGALL